MQKISKTAARAVLAELQDVADEYAKLKLDDEWIFMRTVIGVFVGRLEARLPRAEWNKTDVFRNRKKTA